MTTNLVGMNVVDPWDLKKISPIVAVWVDRGELYVCYMQRGDDGVLNTALTAAVSALRIKEKTS